MEKYLDLIIDSFQSNENGFRIQWSSPSLGFGEVTFGHGPDKKLVGTLNESTSSVIETECMTVEFVKAILNKFVEKSKLT